MVRCSLCGRFYIYKTGKPIKKAMVAQGPSVQTEFPEGICGDCRTQDQTDVALVYIGDDDLYGAVID